MYSKIEVGMLYIKSGIAVNVYKEQFVHILCSLCSITRVSLQLILYLKWPLHPHFF